MYKNTGRSIFLFHKIHKFPETARQIGGIVKNGMRGNGVGDVKTVFSVFSNSDAMTQRTALKAVQSAAVFVIATAPCINGGTEDFKRFRLKIIPVFVCRVNAVSAFFHAKPFL